MRKPSVLQRLRAKKTQRESLVIGIAWYSEEQWGLVKAAAVDPERFEGSYPEWVGMAEDALRKIRRSVDSPVKVFVDAGELAAWCLLHGKRNDAAARAQFASDKLRRGTDAKV